MDAINTARRQRLVASLAVVLALAGAVPTAHAAVRVRPRAAALRTHQPAGRVARQAATRAEAQRTAVLAAILLIPPPVDLITDIPNTTPDGTHTIVTGGPDLQIPTNPEGMTTVLHTQSTPEPASLLLGVVGSGFAAAGAWYRRRRARRLAQVAEVELEKVES